MTPRILRHPLLTVRLASPHLARGEPGHDPTSHQVGMVTATRDLALIGAIHQWFDAQVSDHGKHADPLHHQLESPPP